MISIVATHKNISEPEFHTRNKSLFPVLGVQECEEVAIALNAEPRQCADSVCVTAQNESNDMKVWPVLFLSHKYTQRMQLPTMQLMDFVI